MMSSSSVHVISVLCFTDWLVIFYKDSRLLFEGIKTHKQRGAMFWGTYFLRASSVSKKGGLYWGEGAYKRGSLL